MSAYDYVFLGLSITSSWGNGHATTYRGLVRELAARGHRVLFLERDLDFYAANRDLPEPSYCTTRLYRSLDELRDCHTREVRDADLVILGSYVPDGVAVGRWLTSVARGATAFYDIDTPVTLAKLARGEHEYLSSALIPAFDLYLSFTGGPTLRVLERRYKARRAVALHCSVDPDLYYPEEVPLRWDLGYLGTYSEDRQPALEQLLLEPARQWPLGLFHVAGPQYPKELRWPTNVEREVHLAPRDHRAYYRAQRFTLNITRRDMIAAGWSPSVRLFEAAACAVPIISDSWDGLDTVLCPGKEIVIARSPEEVLAHLQGSDEEERRRVGERARRRVLSEHTAAHRAERLERLTAELRESRKRSSTETRAAVRAS
jgi:spore maturation protein CgeB